MALKNKMILITAGPTWVPLDSVRVISNVATGETGILLADKLQKLGAKVTLLLGPVGTCYPNKKIKLINFRFFDELKYIIKEELSAKKYDIVIHSAAVADYRPQISFKKKVESGIKQWKINLTPTPKLIDLIKKIDKALFLVGFKFEPMASREVLISKAMNLIDRAQLDLVVANGVQNNRYFAYIVNQTEIYGPAFNKKDMAEELIKLIGG